MGNFFSDILGTQGLGLTGSEQKTTTQLDPTTKAIDTARLLEIMNIFGIQGSPGNMTAQNPVGDLFNTQQGLTQPGQQTQNIGNQMGQLAQNPGFMSPGDMYGRTVQGLDPSGVVNALQNQRGTNIQDIQAARDVGLGDVNAYAGAANNVIQQAAGQSLGALQGAYGQGAAGVQGAMGQGIGAAQGAYTQGAAGAQAAYGQGMQGLQGMVQGGQQLVGADRDAALAQIQSNMMGNQAFLSQQGTQNLDYIRNTIGGQMVGAGGEYFNKILAPQISNNNALMGLGRAGATQEALSQGAASTALQVGQVMAGLQGQEISQTQMQQAANRAQGAGLQGATLDQAMALRGGLSQTGAQGAAQLGGAQIGAMGQLGSAQVGAMGQIGAAGTGAMGQLGAAYTGATGQLGSAYMNMSGQNAMQAGRLANTVDTTAMNQLGQVDQQMFGAQSMLGGQYLQNLYGANTGYANMQNQQALAQMGLLQTGQQGADYTRLMQQQADQQMLAQYIALINGTPYQPGGSQNQIGNNGLISTVFGSGGSGGQAVAGMAAAGLFT